MRAILIADVDGTLVDDAGLLFASASSFAQRVAAAGIGLGLASARPPWSLRTVAQQLGTPIAWVSAYQGALVQRSSRGEHTVPHESWECVRSQAIARSALRAVARLSNDLSVWWYTEEQWYVNRQDVAAVTESKIVGFRWAGIVRTAPHEPVLKALIVAAQGRDRIEGVVRDTRRLQMVVSKPTYHEILAADVGADKGISCIRRHGSYDAVVAVGDGANDIGMFGAADLSFTFADAPEAVRSSATHVVSAARHDGFNEIERRLAGLL